MKEEKNKKCANDLFLFFYLVNLFIFYIYFSIKIRDKMDTVRFIGFCFCSKWKMNEIFFVHFLIFQRKTKERVFSFFKGEFSGEFSVE